MLKQSDQSLRTSFEKPMSSNLVLFRPPLCGSLCLFPRLAKLVDENRIMCVALLHCSVSAIYLSLFVCLHFLLPWHLRMIPSERMELEVDSSLQFPWLISRSICDRKSSVRPFISCGSYFLKHRTWHLEL
jgi:hypothetical protein